MESGESVDNDEGVFRPFTKKERIQQLNAIDKSVTQLLNSAGLALQTLASSKENAAISFADRRDAFQANTDAFFETLQVIDVGLQRQVLGLEEADIIPSGKKTSQPGTKAKSSGEQVEGRLGKLDIGWLNSRSGVVDRNLEAELWDKSRKYLEDVVAGKDPNLPHNQENEVEMTS